MGAKRGSRPWATYAYSVVSVRQSTIAKQPQVVQAFVDAVRQALRLTAKDRGALEAMTRKEFPTLAANGVKATLDHAYADHLRSTDGMVSRQGYNFHAAVLVALENLVTGLARNPEVTAEHRHFLAGVTAKHARG